MKGLIKGIEIIDPNTHEERIQFDIEIPKVIEESDIRFIDLQLLECSKEEEKSVVRFYVHKLKSADEDWGGTSSYTVVPFQIAYAIISCVFVLMVNNIMIIWVWDECFRN